VSDFRSSGIK
jgi:hypothetical protein